MKREFLVSGLLAVQSLAAQNTFASESTKKSICSAFNIDRDARRISTFEKKLNNGTLLCADVLLTDDQRMLELVIYKKNKNEVKVFGGLNGDEEQIFILENPMESGKHGKSFVGITCNSSRNCQTGETFVAFLNSNGQELNLFYPEKTGATSGNLNFLPNELKDYTTLVKSN